MLLVSMSASGFTQPIGNQEIVTDRPDITESAVVVPKASVQVENGVTWTDNGPSRLISLCQSLIRIGLGSTTELRLAVPAYSLNLFGRDAVSGFSDLSIGFKRQIGPLPGRIELSVIVAASIPTGTASQTSHRVDPFLKIPWSRDLGHGWSIGGMASLFWSTENGRRNPTWEPTLVLEREITKPLDVFVEYGSDYRKYGDSKQTIHFGTAYRITSAHQIDFHFGFGLSSATPASFFAAGYSFRIDRLWGN